MPRGTLNDLGRQSCRRARILPINPMNHRIPCGFLISSLGIFLSRVPAQSSDLSVDSELTKGKRKDEKSGERGEDEALAARG